MMEALLIEAIRLLLDILKAIFKMVQECAG